MDKGRRDCSAELRRWRLSFRRTTEPRVLPTTYDSTDSRESYFRRAGFLHLPSGVRLWLLGRSIREVPESSDAAVEV